MSQTQGQRKSQANVVGKEGAGRSSIDQTPTPLRTTFVKGAFRNYMC